MMFISNKMHNLKLNHPILMTESEGSTPNEYVYIKSSENNQVLRVCSSLKPPKSVLSNFCGVLKDIFLPRGYPESVSKDYVQYQLWDTLQACCSTITGTLATRAILQGIGVGDSAANSISAAVTWVLKDGIGMLARIMFAWFVGSGLDAECKKWRMFADFVNDFAIFIEIVVLPHFGTHAIYILCLSTSLKGLVGIAGGATRAAITQHQAIKDNMADVSAKDGSQETCVNLFGSIIGVGLLSIFGNSSILWYLFVGLTYLHLYANFKAVKSINFNYFNNERIIIFLKEYLMSDLVLPPQEINKRESVFLGFGETDQKLCGYSIKIGRSLEKLTKSNHVSPFQIQFLAHLYRERKFMILLCEKEDSIYVILDAKSSPEETLEAYFHAVLLGIGASHVKGTFMSQIAKYLSKDEKYKEKYMGNYVPGSIIKKLTEALGQKKLEYSETKCLDFTVLMAIDQIASQNVKQFLNKASLMGWEVERNLLDVHKWRAYWGDQRSELSDDFDKDR